VRKWGFWHNVGMDRTTLIQSIRQKYAAVQGVLHERGRRIWAASEASQLGWGGVSLVEEAIGISHTTIRRGLREIQSDQVENLPQERSRLQGGGRNNVETIYSDIREQLDMLIDPVTRGDPESPLRWTCKSTRRLSEELQNRRIHVSHSSVRHLLYDMGYSLQANRKTREGEDHPDRNAQFLYISDQVKTFLHADQPVISVDTKKKENPGNYSNKGREYRPKGKPIETNTHDFPNEELGTAIPYGVYDIAKNEGWVSIGINHDTAQFAANSIRRWRMEMGQYRFPQAKRLLITADGGGSNSHRTRLGKVVLRELSNDLKLNITVCHFPPGTSKWNKIEHRLFSFISQNWRGQPLYDLMTVVNLISHTTTNEGLTVRCAVDDTKYEKGIKVTDAELEAVGVNKHDFHGDWNYTFHKRKFR
jgi:transposase